MSSSLYQTWRIKYCLHNDKTQICIYITIQGKFCLSYWSGTQACIDL